MPIWNMDEIIANARPWVRKKDRQIKEKKEFHYLLEGSKYFLCGLVVREILPGNDNKVVCPTCLMKVESYK